ncbi:MAG: protein kinase domain-containing protein [Actinomycetota bacterium]
MKADPRVGTELAGHRILSVIGRGGMAVVYLAEHLRLGRNVALKVLDPVLADDEAFRERFIRESRIAAGLDHPNVVTVYDAGEADGVLYLSMRFVEGTDLERLLQAEGHLPPDRAIAIVSQCAAALDAAHADGLIHRGIKPADILLQPVGDGTTRAFLSDFGITKDVGASTRLTRAGSFVDTVDYVAPEQIQGEDVDRRADVYSLGCVLYRCLTGEVPFPRDSELVAIYAHLNDPPPRPSERRPDLPSGLDDVMARAMAKPREGRYASCGELAQVAGEVLAAAAQVPTPEGESAGVGSTEEDRSPSRFSSRGRVLPLAAVAAVALVALVGALMAGSSERPRPMGTPPASGQAAVPGRTGAYVIAAAGEIACPSDPFPDFAVNVCQYDDTASLIRPGELAAVLALGDNQYDDGAYEDYTAFYDRWWGHARSITKPVPGNHESPAGPTSIPDGYFRYFGEAVEGPHGLGYYSFDLPGGCTPGQGVCWHFIALNSELCVAPGGCEPTPDRTDPGLGNRMYAWLKHDLATHPNSEYRCTVAYWHRPLFSFSTGSGTTPQVRPLWDALYAARADVVLNGHSHNYQRWRPQDPEGRLDPRRGILQFIVGTGGSSKSQLQSDPWPSNLVAAQDTSFGVLQITLGHAGFAWEWVSAPGQPAFSDTQTDRVGCI